MEKSVVSHTFITYNIYVIYYTVKHITDTYTKKQTNEEREGAYIKKTNKTLDMVLYYIL